MHLQIVRHSRVALLVAVVVAALALVSAVLVTAQDDMQPAKIVRDEGGPVEIHGRMTYSNPEFFLRGVAQPLVLLEDQAGFVDRNLYFHFPPESQTLGQFTSNFYESPVTYNLAVPTVPQGSYRDVDQDDDAEQGVQIYAVAYWTNVFGDPFLEERDMQGGGWSSAYASTRVSEDAETFMEIVGGTYLVYAPDDQQGFPSGFGPDGLLFTADDPIVGLPAGYTVVNLDTTPFTFSRERVAEIDLIEPETAALADFSEMGLVSAFDAMVEKLRREYAFTEHKGIDWDALIARFRPRFERAEAQQDAATYWLALREFILSIPDGHINAPMFREDYLLATEGGIGIAIRETDAGRVIVNYVAPETPAEAAGIALGAEVLALNDRPIHEVIENTQPYEGPFSTEHVRRLQQLRYATRFPVGQPVDITYQNPNADRPQTASLVAVTEPESFAFSSLYGETTGFELPVEFTVLPNGYGLVRIYSLSDNELLTVQLWERMIQTMNEGFLNGLIVDMRQNSGGSSFLTDQLAAYFFNEPLVVSRSAMYDEKSNQWVSDPRADSRLYLPAPSLRYHGPVAVLVGPNCLSACEYFAHAMTQQDRAITIGQYPTGGLGGGIMSGSNIRMPGGFTFQFPAIRSLAADSDEIIIEGVGVAPEVRIPVTEETLLNPGDVVLDAAVQYLNQHPAF